MVTPQVARQNIQTRLCDLFAARRHEAEAYAPSYAQLWDVIANVSLAGGKRIRPYLVELAYEAIAQKTSDEAIRQAGLAIELLHIAVLMHDDIIDRDTMRHGQTNVTGRYQEIYASESDTADTTHLANSSALIAGDLLLAEAYRTIALINHARATDVMAAFHTGVVAVCGGELLDTETSVRTKPADAMTICSLKTASYSFVMPLSIGAILAGADNRTLAALREFGEALGTAFQLTDDLLGVFGDDTKTGKSTTGDIREGKKTYLVEHFYQHATVDQRVAFDVIFGHADLSNQAYAEAAQLLIDSGAQVACLETINRCNEDARTALEQLHFTPDYHQAFIDLIERCTRREA